MKTLRIGRLAHACGLLLAISALLTLTGSARFVREPNLRVVFLAHGSPQADGSYQRFRAALTSRHPALYAQTSIEALSVVDDEATLVPLVQQAAASGPTLFVAQNGTQARLVRLATATAPLIFSSHADPRDLGLVADLLRHSQPSTGLWINDSLDAKRLELLMQAYPSVRRVAMLGDDEWYLAASAEMSAMQAQAHARGVRLSLFQAHDVDAALALVDGPEGLDIRAWCLPRTTLTLDGRLGKHLAASGRAVMAAHTPDVYEAAHLSYAHDKSFVAPAMADLVARVLNGESPSQIPVQLPQRYQLAVRVVDDPRLPALNSEVVRRADLVLR
ncbi:ABC transporter substrate binding protein [Roseateles sp. NT4]|uniref:ABC transporter substrate binding protein n=1 Tax=Roseateles sp. NT4 TaxID=3453715 RepID=UPI003EE9CD16